MATHVTTPLDLELEKEKYFEQIGGKLLQRELGGGTHSQLQYKLLTLLKPVALERKAQVWQEWSLAHGDDWMIPDVMMSFPGPIREDFRGYLIAPAFLCIEIVSGSQSEAEQLRKCYRYYEWGVPHSWVINPKGHACFEYHGGEGFVLAPEDGVLTAGDIRVPISEIFAG